MRKSGKSGPPSPGPRKTGHCGERESRLGWSKSPAKRGQRLDGPHRGGRVQTSPGYSPESGREREADEWRGQEEARQSLSGRGAPSAAEKDSGENPKRGVCVEFADFPVFDGGRREGEWSAEHSEREGRSLGGQVGEPKRREPKEVPDVLWWGTCFTLFERARMEAKWPGSCVPTGRL